MLAGLGVLGEPDVVGAGLAERPDQAPLRPAGDRLAGFERQAAWPRGFTRLDLDLGRQAVADARHGDEQRLVGVVQRPAQL